MDFKDIPDIPHTPAILSIRKCLSEVSKVDPDGFFLETHCGNYVPLLGTPGDIAKSVLFKDIYTGLSNTARYSGQTNTPYSVAEHSILVAYLAHLADEPIEVVRYCLLHDISESLLVDIPSPLKSLLGNYREIEENMMHGMMLSLEEDYNEYMKHKATVRKYDLIALGIEMRAFNLKAFDIEMAKHDESLLKEVDRLSQKLKAPFCCSPFVARGAFLTCYNALRINVNPFSEDLTFQNTSDLVKLQLRRRV